MDRSTIDIEKLQNLIIDSLGQQNIAGILLYGGYLYSENLSDLDVIIVLESKEQVQADLLKLKLIKDSLTELKLDLQLIYLEEITSGDYFALDTHGAYFIEVLKNAEVIFGTNPFINISLDSKTKNASISSQIQYYVFRARQELLGHAQPSKDQSPIFHQKKLKQIMIDLLLLKNISVTDQSLTSVLSNFDKVFPDKLSKNEKTTLERNDPISISEVSPIYEHLYSISIELVKELSTPKKLKKPTRWNLEGIVSEVLIPSESNKAEAIILLEGLPSVPERKDTMNLFAEQGYTVIFPRYRGTWESEGVFLEESPVKDIEQICLALKEGITLNGQDLKFDKFIAIGTSFGGSIALSLADKDFISKIISLSPVTDYPSITELATLPDYISNAFPGGYRASSQNWGKLLNGTLITPKTHQNSETSQKHLVLGGEEDETVTPSLIKSFTQEYSIKTVIYPNEGHLSFSKISPVIFKDIAQFLGLSD